MKEYANYESYDFDRLTEGSQIKIEHTVYCKETDMSDLISKPLTELMDLREGSAIAEQAAYENVRRRRGTGKSKLRLHAGLTGRLSI